MNVNTTWFKAAMRDRGISLRRLAGLMELDVGALSRAFNGKRKITMEEANRLAEHLDKSLADIISYCGIPVRRYEDDGRTVPLAGTVDAAGAVAAAAGETDAPPGALASTRALRFRDVGLFEGWVFYYNETKTVAADAAGRLCVVTTGKHATPLLCFVRRGAQRALHALVPLVGGTPEDAMLLSAAPVTWIRA